MRSQAEMFALFAGMARDDERIRALFLEGSRANPKIVPDIYQDYDVTFLVTSLDSFLVSDDWLVVFGERAVLQKPEAMALFPPDPKAIGFSYLMLFHDGVKIDLTLVPLAHKERYFASDPLIQVLLDKDGLCASVPPPSDGPFWVQRPSAEFFADCSNEFWFVSTYVAKGLLRGQLLYANWHFEQILRKELLRMVAWALGTKLGYPFNSGKYHREIVHYLSESQNELLLETYRIASVDETWNALYAALTLFSAASIAVAHGLGFTYPSHEVEVRRYIEVLKNLDVLGHLD